MAISNWHLASDPRAPTVLAMLFWPIANCQLLLPVIIYSGSILHDQIQSPIRSPRKSSLLIFDLDGTLIDSRLDLVHSVNATLRHMKRPELPDDVIASYVGDGAPALIGRALGSEANDEKLVRSGLEYFLTYYREHKLDHTHLYDGIVEALASHRRIRTTDSRARWPCSRTSR